MIPWIAARQVSVSITNSRSPPKPMSIESVMPSNHLILYHPLLLSPSIFPSIRVFPSVSCRIRWPKYWSFSFNISPSNEHSGLISCRMDWLDLLAVLGYTELRNSSFSSILWKSWWKIFIIYFLNFWQVYKWIYLDQKLFWKKVHTINSFFLRYIASENLNILSSSLYNFYFLRNLFI